MSISQTSSLLPASITAPPTFQFTPPPACIEPDQFWEVRDTCYIPTGTSREVHRDCSLSYFGVPDDTGFYCGLPQSNGGDKRSATVTQDGTVGYYAGCPVGFTSLTEGSYIDFHHGIQFTPDATIHVTWCCPTHYPFAIQTTQFIESLTYEGTDGITSSTILTEHFVRKCTATSISELVGKKVAIQTWPDDEMPTDTFDWHWDESKAMTRLWNENDTMYANIERFSYTVYESTHTCYASCSSWFDYYYPNPTDTSDSTTDEVRTTSDLGIIPTSQASPSSGITDSVSPSETSSARPDSTSTTPSSGPKASSIPFLLGFVLIGITMTIIS